MTRLAQEPKLPPHSYEAEQSVLGGLMLDNSRIDDVLEVLGEGDFYRTDHQLIFRAILGALAESKASDMITVSEWLKARGKLDEAGGLFYIGTLANEVPRSGNVVVYANVVRERALLRRLISEAGEMADAGYRPEGRTPDEILDDAERRILAIRSTTKQQQGVFEASDLIAQVEIDIGARRGGNGVTGLTTGLADLDAKTTGLHPGELIVLAGRPSMGKTSLAMNFVEACAFIARRPALVFSMEMPAKQLLERLVAGRASVNMHALRSGSLSEYDYDRMTGAGAEIRRAAIRIDETPALSPSAIRARARREKARRGDLGLIVIDYMQLMQVPGTKENRTGEISQISRELKALAKELAIPVIALSQLNRSVENRDNKRPRMADLRESGGIEQDADLIVFVYRDEVYHEDSREAGTAEIIIGKQRNGALGTVRTAFRGEYCRFESLAHDWCPAPLPESKATPIRGFAARGRGMSHAAHAVPND